MSYTGLPRESLSFLFAAGLDGKTDPRAAKEPALAVARDVQFDEFGGLQTRYPYAAMSTSTDVGVTLDDIRKLVTHGDELIAFTKDAIYSWSPMLAGWCYRGVHLAAEIDEASRFITTGEQLDADRAELNGVTVFAWVEEDVVYIAALDATSGAVIFSPTAIPSANTDGRPRLVALDSRILLTWTRNGSLIAIALDPTDLANSYNDTPDDVCRSADGFNSYYDICSRFGQDAAFFASRLNPTTSYMVGTVAWSGSALVVTTSTKARDCNGPIAVASHPNATHVQVIRADGTDILGDYILADLSDVDTDQAVGTVLNTPVNQIAAAYRSVEDSSEFRCYAFWSAQEATSSTGFQSKYNYVDTSGATGTQAVMVLRLGIASRAFDHDGRVYVWGAFAGSSASSGMGMPLGIRAQLQNTYYLYRDDAFLVAKAAHARAGGFSTSTGRLPGVEHLGGDIYAWCGIERRIIELGGTGHTGYGDRGPRDIRVTFDSDAARRTASLGRTLYIAGGEILQYDGVGTAEVGFHVYPWSFATVGLTGSGGEAIPDGDYSYKSGLRWDNAQGETERSTTATGELLSLAGGPSRAEITVASLGITHKRGGRHPVVGELWRTRIDAPDGDPFYLITSKDPTELVGDNHFIVNDATTGFWDVGYDNFTDAELEEKEQHPENDGTLENIAPPAAGIVIATDTRLFLGGVAGDPDRVWYSRQRLDGQVAAFHEILTIDVPRPGGAMTALAVLNDTLIVFRETAIYMVAGDGHDNTGGGFNYGPARLLSSDVGAVSHEAVALTPMGLVFKSNKGWYLLNRGWALDYIGAPVSDFDSDTVKAVHVVESKHQIRCLTGSRLLVLDYLVNQWAEWTVDDGVSATMWRGSYVYAASDAAKAESTSYSSLDYGIDIESAWIKPADLMGEFKMQWIEVLGEYRSACGLRIRVARDYQSDGAGGWTWFDDTSWTVTPTTVGGPLQFKHGPSIPTVRAVKVRLTAVASSADNTPPSGEAFKLTGLKIDFGRRQGHARRLPSTQVA